MATHPVIACYRGPDSAGAVELGAALASLLQERLVLAGAYTYTPVALSARAHPSPYNAVRADAAEAHLGEAHRLVGRDDLEVVERVLPADGTVPALAELARETDACLLVVGRDHEGHVTRSLLTRSPCPVAVSPSDVALPADPSPPRTVGVAYDGSPGSRRAVTAAQHLAIRAGARLRLIVVGPDAAAVDVDGLLVLLEETLDVDVARPVGLPERRLVTASADVDLLVCGSHSHGAVLAKVLGSVSAHLVKCAKCPVIVVPARAHHHAATPLGVSTAAATR